MKKIKTIIQGGIEYYVISPTEWIVITTNPKRKPKKKQLKLVVHV